MQPTIQISPAARSLLWQALGRLHQLAAGDDVGRLLIGVSQVVEVVGLDLAASPLAPPTPFRIQPAVADRPVAAGSAWRVVVELHLVTFDASGLEVGSDIRESELILETTDKDAAVARYRNVIARAVEER